MIAQLPGRAQYQQAIDAIGQGLVERDEAVRLLIVAALGGEHLLLIGPPGTAKSELAKRLHRVFGGRYFERLLTRFSVPEELFGPLSLAALDDGRYERDIDGYLPTASVAFLDEVFKANSAILNALLTVLNEREFDQGAQRISVPLISLVAASNDVPDDDTLLAFQDRFLLRCVVEPVSDGRFAQLLLTAESAHSAPSVFAEQHLRDIAASTETIRFDPELAAKLGLLRGLLRQRQCQISDRRWVRAVRLLKVCALTNGREQVDIDDLWLLASLVGEQPEQAQFIDDWFCTQMGVSEAIEPVWAERIVSAFEKQLQLEQNATELTFDDSGKLSLLKRAAGADEATVEGAIPRMSAFSRRKLYSASHIGARIEQIEQCQAQFDQYLARGQSHRDQLQSRLADNLWLPERLAQRLMQDLAQSLSRVDQLREQLSHHLGAYRDLPLAQTDDGQRPPAVDVAA